MNIEKTTIAKIFKTKDTNLLRQAEPKMFIRKFSKITMKGLHSYYKKFGIIPDIKPFAQSIKTKVPVKDSDNIVAFLDGILLEKEEVANTELLAMLIEQYSLHQIDESVKELVMSAQQRNLQETKDILTKLQKSLIIEDKLPKDITEEDYEPHNIKLIEAYLPSMQTNNLKLGGVVLIGGTSGGGKSVFTLEQLLHSFKQGSNTCLLNLELGYDETIARMYVNQNQEEMNDIYGNSDAKIVKKVNEWKNKFFDRENRFFIKNTNFDKEEIEHTVRELHKVGVTVFGLDYIQLVESANSFEEWKNIRDLVRTLHRLTQELGIVVITPVQINLTDVKEKEGELKISVRGSKELEYSSTVFLFIYQTKAEFKEGMGRVFTIKARNAAKNTYIVKTNFNKMSFEDTGVIL